MIKLKLDHSVCSLQQSDNQRILDAINGVLDTLPSNRIVTKLNIDGKRFSPSQENQILSESIESSHDIEILTADRAIWAATGYDIALSCIERIQKSVLRSAELFRESDKLNANRLFLQCIDGLERFLEALTITKIATNLDFSKTQVMGISISEIEADLQKILTSIFSFQQQEDYQGLADKIEYALLTNLSNWVMILKQLRAEQNSNA